MSGATCSQIDRAKAWAARNGYWEDQDGIHDNKGVVAKGWHTFYVSFLYDIERDGCAT